jgi:hypothetical protein
LTQSPIGDILIFSNLLSGHSPISENWHLLDIKWQCYYLQRDYAAAIEVVRQMSPTMLVPADTSHYHFDLAELYCQLGDTAMSYTHYDTATIPLRFDALVGMERLEDLALTYIGVAEYDLALDVIDTLLSIPSVLSVAWIKTSPDFDPLRDHPRFQALIQKCEKEKGP